MDLSTPNLSIITLANNRLCLFYLEHVIPDGLAFVFHIHLLSFSFWTAKDLSQRASSVLVLLPLFLLLKCFDTNSFEEFL